MDKAKLTQEAIKWRRWFQRGQKLWSFAHHSTLFGSILCSVVAGAFLQMDPKVHDDIAAVLTTFAAALTGLAASGGFERKWRSNRLSRYRVDCLLIDIEAESPNILDLSGQLKDIISKHDQEIVKEEAAEQPGLSPNRGAK